MGSSLHPAPWGPACIHATPSTRQIRHTSWRSYRMPRHPSFVGISTHCGETIDGKRMYVKTATMAHHEQASSGAATSGAKDASALDLDGDGIAGASSGSKHATSSSPPTPIHWHLAPCFLCDNDGQKRRASRGGESQSQGIGVLTCHPALLSMTHSRASPCLSMHSVRVCACPDMPSLQKVEGDIDGDGFPDTGDSFRDLGRASMGRASDFGSGRFSGFSVLGS